MVYQSVVQDQAIRQVPRVIPRPGRPIQRNPQRSGAQEENSNQGQAKIMGSGNEVGVLIPKRNHSGSISG
jgi:hypothetical protein